MNEHSEPGSAGTRPAAITLDANDMDSYNALQSGVAFFDLSPRHVSSFKGPAAGSALNGLVTNDVSLLAVGRGLYAVALTPKGKVLADLIVLRTEPETFLVETTASAGAEWFAMVRKYINPRLAQYRDESESLVAIGVYGPEAVVLLARMAGAVGGGAILIDAFTEALQAWPEWANAIWTIPGAEARIIRAPYLGATPGFILLVAPDAVEALRSHLQRFAAVAGTVNTWNMAALESGRPVFGLDMDAATIPQEANLDEWNAISFEKGCYTGQETVARIHFRGHVNKHLRLLTSDDVPSPGSVITDAAGKAVGEVRRSGLSPRRGAITIAMLRRESLAGAEVTISGNHSVIKARVHDVALTAGRSVSP